MTVAYSIDQRIASIARGLTGVAGLDEIRSLLEAGKTPKGFWATAPTGKPHIGYFVPLLKLAEFAKVGLDVTVLACDLYAFLVNYVHPMDLVAHRTQYYRHITGAVFNILGVPKDQIHFVEASSYELTKEFMIDTYKLAALTDEKEVRNTGDEYRNSTKLSVLFCPGLPGLAEEYLDSDFQFGGEDQKGLFEFNECFLPQLGYRKRAHLMNPLVPGLLGPKMSSSIPDSKIEFLDSPEEVHRKVNNASCEYGKGKEDNGVLAVLYHIVLPIRKHLSEISGNVHVAEIQIETEAGSTNAYSSFEDIERDFNKKIFSVNLLKTAVATAICDILAPLRKLYDNDKAWRDNEELAYPGEQ